jgi:2-oxoglutarate decarboxylase
VKYHLGASGTFKTTQGKEVMVSVAFNPSHLEAVDPVVEGIVRPKQDRSGDTERERVIPVLIHGDAAFAGQGVVAETLNLSQLDGYTTGGTLHLVINNQIGFTTNPREARSSGYATDMARMVQAPIFHVNGDDVEACVRAAQLAFDFRQQYKKDVVIDMVCYRRWGHNEGDDPSYTQPALYRKIKDHPSVAKQYGQKLVAETIVDAGRLEAIRKAVSARLNAIYDESKVSSQKYEVQELSAVNFEPVDRPSPETAISREMAQTIIEGLATFPPTFHLHPKLKGFVEKRKEILSGTAMDWATGEALAFGSLVLEGTPVRLSGQDSGRGTFSQRHLEFSDYESGKSHIPMQHLSPSQARFDVIDSSLSEYAVMGFEFGFSVADPWTLVLWEAQFGDFANGAQIMIDQFVSSAETKWSQPSGLVLLLPHGFEGQGPEHSSARMERFLQLCGDNNMQVVNASTPSQYFHLLRRQMYGGPDRRGVRKPLIVFTPKRMLRDPRAVSTLNEVISGRFREVLPDTSGLDPARVTRVLFCCGQLYYDLAAARKDRTHVAICRLEQLYPFAFDQVKNILAQYPAATEVVWVQEEPRNMGAWRSVQDNFQTVLEGSKKALRYVGRADSASPAGGSLKRHQQEQADLIENAFAVEIKKPAGRRRKVSASD